ncbi:MAG TPA: MATE family efflux transporter, partial [Treponemataceae bacterium]|nr:MATE family efflux transporter [Treponemataceae bacterium]
MKSMTEGRPAVLILKFSMPLLAGNLLQQMYNLVDSVVVGQLVGKEALAAVGSTNILNFLMISLFS